MLDFEHGTKVTLICRIAANNTNDITIRGATKAGPFTFPITPVNNTRSFVDRIINLPDIPIWISAADETGNQSGGTCFISVSLGFNGDLVYNLFSGYVFFPKLLSWPIAQREVVNPFSNLSSVSGANPAAGVETSITVPAAAIWKIRAWSAQLVNSANVANRIVHLVFKLGGSVPTAECIAATASTISQTRIYTAFPNLVGNSVADDNDIIIAIPHDLVLYPGSTITTETTGLNAADDWGSPTCYFEEYITY